ncbi:hypothetical protein CAPTEDRAFT_116396 [Capitella teleta]|uniref:G-protein coupled receptors family 1 profile domain-containing protein n=1 Tax=Capitella teleta TaxID=283909 RepID=R7URU9_CAPTE|nr:hypothetical protein CAPTEDRAFT_116396 [Capitella teleta]|eukprot:ELU09249.1 hypothetical protein CAPTEDRAFT_116396 [Capitella teleta]
MNDSQLNSTASSQIFDKAVGVWLPGIFCVLGIVGNMVSLAVLSLDRSISPTFLTLKALALSDIILLSAAFLQQVVPIYAMLEQCMSSLCLRVLPYLHGYLWPIICITQMTSVYFTVLISAERYAAICLPLRTKQLRSLARIRSSILFITTFSIVFNIPKFFELSFKTELTQQPMTNMTLKVVIMEDGALRRQPLYRYLYNSALYAVLMYALPLVVLTVLNISIVQHMQKARQRWSELNRALQRELKATAVPLCIVVVFVLCGTQALITFILDAVYVDAVQGSWLQTYTAIANLFIIFNSAVNFVIFYMFGSKFRRLLRGAVPCCSLYAAMGTRPGTPILRRRFNPSRVTEDLQDGGRTSCDVQSFTATANTVIKLT